MTRKRRLSTALYAEDPSYHIGKQEISPPQPVQRAARATVPEPPADPRPTLPRPATRGQTAPERPHDTTNGSAHTMNRGPQRQPSLTIPEVIAELRVSRSTFYYWRQTGKAPRCIKLPNGEIRVRRGDLDAWLEDLEEAA